MTTKDELCYYNKKITKVLSLDLDDFDKLTILQEWFNQFNKDQRKNLIKILVDGV